MKVFDLLARKGHEVLLDSQEHLTLDLAVMLAQELKVRKKSTGNSILDRHDCSIGLSLIHLHIQFIERSALHHLRLLTTLLLVEHICRLLMEAPLYSLNRYSFHLVVYNKKRCPANTGQHIKVFYIIRYTAPGLLPFLEIEIIKTEAVKSMIFHNGHKYSKYLTKQSSFPSLLLPRARPPSLRKRLSPSVRAARTPSGGLQAYRPCLPS